MDRQVAAAVAAWRRADERLYPVVMVDPQRYTRIVSVVRAVADRLADHETVEDLVAARPDGHDVVVSACETSGVPVEHLGNVDAVADAAFGLRHREIEVTRRRQHTTARVVAARANGDPWVTIVESGRADHPGVAPFQRIDMCLADGSAIRAAVDVDPDSYNAVYSIELLRLDPATGGLTDVPAGRDSETFTDPEPWQAAVARWRAGVASRGQTSP
ncbi:hypothetical protein BH23ACT10_BH23ACT10_19170 [soil metagenome]